MKKNECSHPKAYISTIGKYSVCNLCGEKFFESDKPKEEPKVEPVEEIKVESKVEKVEPVKELPEVKEEVKEEEKIEPEVVEEVKEEIKEAPKPKKKKMLQLLRLISEKKSLYLAQKELNTKNIDEIRKCFISLNLSPITISKDKKISYLPNLYKYFDAEIISED